MKARTTRLGIFALAATGLAACSSGDGAGPGAPSCPLPGAAALQVAEIVPASGAQGVSTHATVSIRFNTCLEPASVSAATVALTATGLPVTAARRYDPATATLTIVPSGPLAPTTPHAVYLTALRGLRGEALASPFLSTFRTRALPESVPPTTAASPPGGRYAAPQAVTLACSDEAGGSGCAATYYTLDGSPPTPASPRYTVPIPIAADATLRFLSVDGDGNVETPRAEVYVFDTTPPAVASRDPDAGATGVARSARVRVVFSEPMAPSSLAAANVTMAPFSQPGFAYDDATRTLTLTPHWLLDCGGTYTVTLGTGVRDVAGNGLAAPVSWSFTVREDCDEPATTASVADGVYTAPQAVTLSCADAGSGCARIVYTTDGSVPSSSPPHGAVVAGAAAGPIAIGEGDTVLRFFAEDVAGNREPVREERYSVSSRGFTWVSGGTELARGAGKAPATFTRLPIAGRTYAFFRDPANGRLYRAAERGVAFTDDGVSWSVTALRDPRGVGLRVTAVYAAGSRVLAGTLEGLFVSEDGGATFVYLDESADPPAVNDIDGMGADVYVATSAGLRISHDAGRQWSVVPHWIVSDVDVERETGGVFLASTIGLLHGPPGLSFRINEVANTAGMASNDLRSIAVTPGRVYAGTPAGLVVFTRDGFGNVTFTAQTRTTASGLGDAYVSEVAAGGGKVFAVTGPPWYTGSARSFCVSSDSGTTFTPRSFVYGDDGAIASAVHVEGANVYVGYSPGWYLSADGGDTFEPKELPSGGARVVAGGGKLFAAVPSSTGTGGIAVSSDGFRTFAVRGVRDGLARDQVEDLAFADGTLYAATSSGLGVSTDGGATFANRTTADGLFVSSIECVAAQPGAVWAATTSTLDVSRDGGASFARAIPAGGLPLPKAAAASGQAVYLATSSDLRASSDGGATFATRGPAEGLAATQLLDVALAADGTAYVATSTGAFLSTDGGATFTPVPGIAATDYVEAIDVTDGALYVSVAGKGLGISTDGGATFAWRSAAQGVERASDVLYVP